MIGNIIWLIVGVICIVHLVLYFVYDTGIHRGVIKPIADKLKRK